VINAARAFSPSPAPITAPAAMAITFFAAPPTWAPIGSSLPYSRNDGVPRDAATASRRLASMAATTAAAGNPAAISWAKFGPVRMAAGVSGRIAVTISSGRHSVSCSSPWQTRHVPTPRHTRPTPRSCPLLRAASSARSAASGNSDDTSIGSGSRTPGRCGFSRLAAIVAARVGSRAHMVTLLPARAAWIASAVPQAPAPNTATLLIDDAPDRCGLAGSAIAQPVEQRGQERRTLFRAGRLTTSMPHH
jgi:hypothetical protein